MSEAAKIMRIFESVADSMPGRKFAIPITETTGDFIASQIRSWKNPPSLVPFKDRYGLYNRAGLAVATSGTATAELAMMRVPSVVVYRSNFLTRAAVRLVIKIKYASMVNILAGREIYPELLGRSVNAENILFALKNIDAAKMRRELAAADHFWHKKQSPVKIVADHLASA
jgi:lipid-A-disaccharide synthase